MTNATDVIILCGGLGKRLRPAVGRIQKTMATVDGRPFLDLQIDFLKQQGFKHVILATGYHADEVKDYFSREKKDVLIEYSQEAEPLGTGGALLHAQDFIQSDAFVVLNGDSFCDVDYASFLRFHVQRKALVTMVLTKMKDKKEYGSVIFNEEGRIVSFREKSPEIKEEEWVNAGIYCFQKEIFSFMTGQSKFSLEQDFFPLITQQKVFGYQIGSGFIDIGTPERYQKAQQILRKAEERWNSQKKN